MGPDFTIPFITFLRITYAVSFVSFAIALGNLYITRPRSAFVLWEASFLVNGLSFSAVMSYWFFSGRGGPQWWATVWIFVVLIHGAVQSTGRSYSRRRMQSWKD